jgi:hypothetical protein
LSKKCRYFRQIFLRNCFKNRSQVCTYLNRCSRLGFRLPAFRESTSWERFKKAILQPR